MQVLVECIQIL